MTASKSAGQIEAEQHMASYHCKWCRGVAYQHHADDGCHRINVMHLADCDRPWRTPLPTAPIRYT